MNLIRKGHGFTHRGIIGIESAIVLIAFVIVAAALAFVVLNMGFATTQKAKTSIISSLSEAGSSLEISGKVVGFAFVNNGELNATSIPMKITSGGDSIDLTDSRVAVKYVSNTVEYGDILLAGCTLDPGTFGTFSSTAAAFAVADNPGNCAGFGGAGENPLTPDFGSPTNTVAVIYWAVNTNGNSILEGGEHAVLGIAFDDTPAAADRPRALDTVRAEIILPAGATLTVERDIPNISTSIVDLG